MKRRQYLTGVGGLLGGAGVLGSVAQSSCSESHKWKGKIEDESVDLTGDISVTIEGYAVETVEWSIARGMLFASIDVTEQSCASVTETTITVPETDEYCQRMVILLRTKTEEIIIGQLIQKDGSWIPLITDDTG